ncbi:MAG: GDP-mannose 4,6-dehydratase, partial [Phycisphaerales bacterium]|nr:GDP-mannose 4,6-dehydratase [Phycisphaerales bacterium]
MRKGYEVSGLVEGDPNTARANLAAIRDRLDVRSLDLTDSRIVRELIADLQPHEIYNLAAPSVVGASWNDPPATIAMMTGSVTCLLDAIAHERPAARFFQASSSEIFRGTDLTPQNEATPPRPTSPYGVGKLAGHALVHAYRERHGLHASSGILYNHESPRRPVDFVPSKIVNAAVQIKLGNQSELTLGDLAARRDWGFAGDFVDAMWRMLQSDEPRDYVIARGETHSVDQLVNAAFAVLDLDPARYVRTDPRFMRAGDEAQLVGDPALIAA